MRYLVYFLFLTLVVSCGNQPPNSVSVGKSESFHRHHPMSADQKYFLLDSLAYPGNHPRDNDGNLLPNPVRDWTYTTQLLDTVTNKDLAGQVYVADFFFTSCPTICPTVKAQMLRIYERFGARPDFKLVSFTVDPKRDTPEVMRTYADNLGVTDQQEWWYLYGDRFFTYELDADYLSIAEENSDAPGGFDHTGYVVLVDQQGFVRSYASGLQADEIDHLMEDIELLLAKK